MARNCPDCRAPMNATLYGAYHVDTCSNCGGLYFDEGELDSLRRSSPNALEDLEAIVVPASQEKAAGARRACPACGRHMTSYRYLYTSSVNLDACDECGGIWIQEGELRQISDYLRDPQPHLGAAQARASALAERRLHVELAKKERVLRSLSALASAT